MHLLQGTFLPVPCWDGIVSWQVGEGKSRGALSRWVGSRLDFTR